MSAIKTIEYIDNVEVKTTTTYAAVYSGLATGSHIYKVEIYNGTVLKDTKIKNFTKGTAADTTAPTVPTNLSDSKTATTVTLSWNASTDAVGVVSYNVYKGGVFYSNVASSPAAITGLIASTPYSFTVSALDAAGNQSAQSTALSVTTNAPADTVAPTITTAKVENAEPNKLVVVFSEPIAITNTTGLTITGDTTPTLSAPTGGGSTTITFTLSTALTNGQSVTLNVASSNTIKDAANNALAATTIAITNNVAVATTTYLADDYPNAAYAFDFYKLNSAYTGACIRVRRSDSVEQDIGFSGDTLDESELTTFAGTSDCFLTTFYDQSGNVRNMTQTAASNQPKIVSAGAILKEGTKVTIQFDGVNDFMTIPSLGITTNYHNVFSNFKFRNTNTDAILIEQSTNFNNFTGSFILDREFSSPKKIGISQRGSGGTYKVDVIQSEANVFNLLSFTIDRVAEIGSSIRKNGVNETLTNQVSGIVRNIAIPNQPYYVGSRVGATFGSAQLNLSTLILYTGDQSANLAGIENKINSNYNLY